MRDGDDSTGTRTNAVDDSNDTGANTGTEDDDPDAPNVYPPSEDTYLLRDAAVEEARPDDTVLEVGTGNGVVAAALTDEARRVVASDINPAAVRAARPHGAEAVRADLVTPFAADSFDLVVFNPPYLPSRDDAPDDALTDALAGGETGRETTERFVADVEAVLTHEGRALVVASSASGIEPLEDEARRHNFTAERVASDRYFFEELAVVRLTPRRR